MRIVHWGVLLTFALLVGWGSCDPPDAATVTVPLIGQQTDMWCWAASGQMTMHYVHPASNPQQCDQANKRFSSTIGAKNCCDNPVPDECVNGGWPEYEKYQFTATRRSGPLSWTQIKRQIFCAKKPFAFAWHDMDGGGHMMVATGYKTVAGTRLVTVNNPLPVAVPAANGPPGLTGGSLELDTYETFVGGDDYDHTFWEAYYNIKFTGSQ